MCEHAHALANTKRAYVCAPAGCGKTHLIAETVAKFSAGRELILTHTHAAVDALRRQLRSQHAPTGSYDVDTIAGWALRYANAFPKTCGIKQCVRPSGEQWEATYLAAARGLRKRHIKDIVRLSYTGAFVDEYQD